jgi:hypothetical protein
VGAGGWCLVWVSVVVWFAGGFVDAGVLDRRRWWAAVWWMTRLAGCQS